MTCIARASSVHGESVSLGDDDEIVFLIEEALTLVCILMDFMRVP